MKSLTVLSYNIHKGFSSGGTRFILSRIREALREIKVDIVFLQEVLGEHEAHAKKIRSWPKESQFEFLASEVWPHLAYGKNAVYEEGHHGNAILSRFAIQEHENIDISTNRFESRGFIHAVIKVPGIDKPVHCINVHLGLFSRGRKNQVAKVCHRIHTIVPKDEPIILAGDFNEWSQRLSQIVTKEIGAIEITKQPKRRASATFPSVLPLFNLDRIYVRNLMPISAKVLKGKPWNALSDHYPVYGELETRS